MRVTCAALGVSGRENGVNKNKRANNLSTESSAFGVSRSNLVGSATKGIVIVLHEGLDEPNTADGPKH